MINSNCKGVKVKDVLIYYLEEHAVNQKSYESSRYNCIPINNYFGDMHINSIKGIHIKKYLNQRKMKPNTMKR